MNKKLLSLAVGAALSAAPMFAQADTTIYGLLHLSVDAPDNDASGAADYDDVNIGSNSSRLGIKGSEDLGNGLAAIWQYEVTVDPTEGGNLFGGSRNSFLGLKGGFGTVLAGNHDTPMKDVSRAYDLFGDQVGDSRNVLAGGFDPRWASSVRYMTPKLGAFEAELQYSTDTGVDPAGAAPGTNERGIDDNDADGFSGNVRFDGGFFDVMAAYELRNRNTSLAPGAQDDTSAFRLAAGVTLIDALRINALWQSNIDEGFVDGNDRDIWGLGAAYSFGNSRIKAQWYRADESDKSPNDNGADLWAIGFDHKLSKRTTAYVAYATIDNEDGASFVPWGGGHQLNVGTEVGSDPDVFSVGMIHRF